MLRKLFTLGKHKFLLLISVTKYNVLLIYINKKLIYCLNNCKTFIVNKRKIQLLFLNYLKNNFLKNIK